MRGSAPELTRNMALLPKMTTFIGLGLKLNRFSRQIMKYVDVGNHTFATCLNLLEFYAPAKK
jgi:hypothetical protein